VNGLLLLLLVRTLVVAQSDQKTESPVIASQANVDCVALSSSTNAVVLRLFTNAAQDAQHLFNTLELEAFGETLLKSPPASVGALADSSVNTSDLSCHNLLINGHGPVLAATNSMRLIEQASGPEWRYLVLDATPAYRDQVELFRRGILFVEPDLFVIYDRVVAKAPSNFKLVLHPPAETAVDSVWGDLRLESAKAGFRIHSPAAQNQSRNWSRVESAADKILSNTLTVEMGPTNKLAELELLTVMVPHRAGANRELAFRLLKGDNAIGARIHRDGYPTLIAFKQDLSISKASLTGFAFAEPAGVSVFQSKKKR
jgi:hypothetical protein